MSLLSNSKTIKSIYTYIVKNRCQLIFNISASKVTLGVQLIPAERKCHHVRDLKPEININQTTLSVNDR